MRARFLSNFRARSAASATSLRAVLVADRFLKLGSFFHMIDKEMMEMKKGAYQPPWFFQRDYLALLRTMP